MSSRTSHVIRRQVVEVDLHGTESAGVALHHRLPELCHRDLASALDRALSRCDLLDDWVVVDRLDVDIGRMSPDDLAGDFADAVARAVEAFFRDQPGAVRRRTIRDTADDALVVFLKTGRLPWSFPLAPGRHLEDALVESWTADGSQQPAFNPARRSEILAVLVDASARRRLINQFSAAFLASLLQRLSKDAAASADTCLAWLHDLDCTLPAYDVLVVRLWEASFASLASGAPRRPQELLAAAWRAVPRDAGGRRELARSLQRHIGDAASGTQTSADSSTWDAPPLKIAGQTPHATADEITEDVYVDNAGVVLLHPFLPKCFDALAIADGDRLVQPERALCLLHYLATGQTTAPEYELALAKVLCNVPTDEPASAVTLDSGEAAEAIALLEAAIRNWSALRGTGPDGLRSAFLMRPGMLTSQDGDDWLLRVESSSFDVLLDQLPWGISMIQLPWMNRLLRVEWR